MRQRPFPPAHGGGNLCGKTLPRSQTATPRSQRKYAQPVWANRTLPLLGDIYEPRSHSVSPGNMAPGRAATPSNDFGWPSLCSAAVTARVRNVKLAPFSDAELDKVLPPLLH